MSGAGTAFPSLDPEVSGDFQIDPAHSRIGFVARHAMVTKVRGGFNEFEGTLTLDAEEPAKSTAQLTVDVKSVNTRNDFRDNHLRSGDFFSADQFPQITFQSTKVERTGESTFVVTGDLTIKGVTKEIDVEWEFYGLAKDPTGALRAGFEGRSQLNRSDFGINFNAVLETGGVMVSEKIVLEFDISAIKVTEPQ